MQARRETNETNDANETTVANEANTTNNINVASNEATNVKNNEAEGANNATNSICTYTKAMPPRPFVPLCRFAFGPSDFAEPTTKCVMVSMCTSTLFAQ